MGYTHYWTFSSKVEAEPFARFCEIAGKIITALHEPLKLTGPDETGTPVVTAEKVDFNGANGCENFSIGLGDNGFDFCKTRGLPYDSAVTACLIAAKLIFGAYIRVSSDGDLEDWESGLLAAQAVLGVRLSLSESDSTGLQVEVLG